MTTILVIEDNAAVREELVDILTFENFAVRQAANGRLGVNAVRSAPVDLVLCDLMMPEMDGYATLRALREDPESAALPFLCLTARAERAALRRAMEGGADDYITKPFTADELLAAIRAALAKKASIDQQRASTTERLRTSLTRGLAGDLDGPLRAILDGADAIEGAAQGARLDAVSDLARPVLDAGRQLHRIAENFLLYAQLELTASAPSDSGAAPRGRLVRVDLVVEDILRPLASECGRAADLMFDLHPLLACIDEAYLVKLVEELGRNALTFSPTGTPIGVTTDESRGRAHLKISDQGCGLTPEQMDVAFQLRQPAHPAEKRERFGLGLSIAHRIAALYGGWLEICSATASGTVVSVELPGQSCSAERHERASAKSVLRQASEAWGSAA